MYAEHLTTGNLRYPEIYDKLSSASHWDFIQQFNLDT